MSHLHLKKPAFRAKTLLPIRGKRKARLFATFDFEAKKDDDPRKPGFNRPFEVGFYDSETYTEFRNHPSVKAHPWRLRHVVTDGCVDRFMRHVLGLDGCERHKHEGGPGLACAACEALMVRYCSRTHTLYAHNGGRFDTQFILGWCRANKHRVRFQLSAAMSRIQRLEVWLPGTPRKKLSWIFADSFSLMPYDLRTVAKTFGAGGEGKDDLPLTTHEDDARWAHYNRIDCEVLYRGLQSFYGLVHRLGGEVGLTTPATSMNTFRRAFQRGKIQRNACFEGCDGVCKRTVELKNRRLNLPAGRCCLSCDGLCHGCAHDWIRTGYYGGRTEPFARYAREVFYSDVNSSYAASLKKDMPVGKMIEHGESDARYCDRMAEKYIGFVDATVYIPRTCKIPPLPVREGQKLKFRNGWMRGVWTWDELCLLRHSLVQGTIKTIHKSVWYGKAPVFRDFIDTLYAFRVKHTSECDGSKCGKDYCLPGFNVGLAELAKLMCNALYGKWGMLAERTTTLFVPKDVEVREIPAQAKPLSGKVDDEFWDVEVCSHAPYIIPQISAYVAADARIRLWQGMAWVIAKGGRLYYVDTDSIMASIPLPNSRLLGRWKQEEPGVRLEGDWVLPKLYMLRRHLLTCNAPYCGGCAPDSKGNVAIVKMKGLPKDFKTAENFLRMTQHSRHTDACFTRVRLPGTIGKRAVNRKVLSCGGGVSFERLMMHRTMLREGLLSPDYVKTSKSVRTAYDKRRITSEWDSEALYCDLQGREVPLFGETMKGAAAS